jgi:CheY-like chemotaxis protein
MTTGDTNVLVVEDDPLTLNVERLILEGGGYTVTSAVRGEEAIEMVANASPDLVLLDIGLPGIDGFTTCKVIRKFSQVPIIMVTGSKSGGDKVRGLDLGADDYITKPFSEEELFARSRAVLRRSHAGGRAFRQANLLCRKVLRFVGSIDYAQKGRSVWQGVNQRCCNLVQRGRKRRAAAHESANGLNGNLVTTGLTSLGEDPRLPVFMRSVRPRFINFCGILRNAFLALASRLKKDICYVSDSPLAKRVKASRPAAKLADAITKFRQSELVQKVGSGTSNILEASLSAVIGVFSRPGKRQDPSPQGHRQSALPVHALETAVLPGTNGATPTSQLVFLEELLRAYLREARSKYSDPMISAPVLPLVDVYQQILASSRISGKYSREQFARDVYLLHCSGVDCTPTGARVHFPISRGVPNKTLIVTDDSGREVKYYGVRFTQTQSVDTNGLTLRRPFNASEATRYRAEIQETFRRQMEWPSEAFTRFLVAQLNFGDLDQREIRQFAQITRDSLQGLVKECADDGMTSDVVG